MGGSGFSFEFNVKVVTDDYAHNLFEVLPFSYLTWDAEDASQERPYSCGSFPFNQVMRWVVITKTTDLVSDLLGLGNVSYPEA